VIPLIGVSTYAARAAWGSWERPAAVLPESYYELVGSAGGRPLLLPPLKTAPAGPGFGAAEVIAALDGLILTGGGDVDPSAYGEVATPEVGGVDPVRDGSEQALLAAALAVDMPVLAICRGLQILNICGGHLRCQRHRPVLPPPVNRPARNRTDPDGRRRRRRHRGGGALRLPVRRRGAVASRGG